MATVVMEEDARCHSCLSMHAAVLLFFESRTQYAGCDQANDLNSSSHESDRHKDHTPVVKPVLQFRVAFLLMVELAGFVRVVRVSLAFFQILRFRFLFVIIVEHAARDRNHGARGPRRVPPVTVLVVL